MSSFSFWGMDSQYEKSSIIVFGVPFDGTVSYRPGTRFAPNAMRSEFEGLESYSPLLNKDLEDYKICDIGNLDISFGNTKKILDEIEKCSEKIINDGKIPFMIGGEHLVSLPQIKALHKKYNDLTIIHLDAHTDLRQEYMGEELSHATVMKRAFDIVSKGKIFQFGIRSGTKEEFLWADKNNTYINKFDLKTLPDICEKIKGKPVYVTVDLDVLDPSIFSGTGTPEAGGITYKELEGLFVEMDKLNIVGADIVELSPHYDQSGVSTAVACKVFREMLLSILK